MKLFIISTLIAVSAAARLEHLENSYLPPFGGNGVGHNGASHNGFGAPGANGNGGGAFNVNGFGANGAAGNGVAAVRGANGFGANGAQNGFGGVGGKTEDNTSNRYLPPNEGPAGIASRFQQPGSTQFPGSTAGFGQPGSGFPGQPGQASSAFPTVPGQPGFHGSSSPTGVPGFGQAPAFGQPGFGQKDALSQFPNANRQYLAPNAQSSFDNIPQQSFDEETGYHY